MHTDLSLLCPLQPAVGNLSGSAQGSLEVLKPGSVLGHPTAFHVEALHTRSDTICVITQIAVGCDADILVLDATTYELRYVFAKGKLMRTPDWVMGGAFERGDRIRPRKLQ